MPPPRRALRLAAAFFLGTATAFAADVASSALQKLPTPTPMRAEVAAFAAAHGIRIDGLEAPAGNVSGSVGDAITALVTHVEGKKTSQWLTTFEIAAPNEKERAITLSVDRDMAVNGHVHKFTATSVQPLAITTNGPFASGDKSPPAVTPARTTINPEFLALGLDRGCLVFIGMGEAAAALVKDGAPTDNTPIKITLNNNEERAFGGMFVALLAFVQGVQETPGLRDILWDVVEKPSLWSLVKNRGINLGLEFGSDFGPAETTGWARPEHSLYRLPLILSLNGIPALDCTLFVTSPQPPLLTSAGIVGLIAHTPGKQDQSLEIRVVAAHRAAAAGKAP